ncbi:MAG: hypothetical protein IJZ33_08455 [Clostridia bacterium]|nr:hypothetical protein [Clostridia bacterium]
MKKGVLSILLLFLTVLFCGCQREEASPEQRFLTLLSCLNAEERTAVYSGQDGADKRREGLERIYRREDAFEVFSSVESYGIALSRRGDGYEIHMLLSRHPSDDETVKGVLRGRMELIQRTDVEGYLGEEYAERIASARIYTRGRYHFLLVTEDNLRAMKEIDGIF